MHLRQRTYVAGDDDVVDVLLFTVKSRRGHLELVVAQLDQLKLDGGLVIEATPGGGVERTVAVRDGHVRDETRVHDVLRNHHHAVKSESWWAQRYRQALDHLWADRRRSPKPSSDCHRRRGVWFPVY